MICLIDSGSTKADWIFTDGKNKSLFNTPGMNPFFIKEKEVIKLIEKGITGIPFDSVESVRFFGAGCSGKKQKAIIESSFKKVFKRAKISADHDTLGAVIATCGDKKGISCILGTGSNSVYFDGKKIRENNYGLGYILGDEGAGTYLGKKLITHYLYGLLPGKLSADFKKSYKLSRQDVITHVYNKPAANAWLASFVPFYSKHIDNFWIRNTIQYGFDEFINMFVMNYPEYKKVPVHFVGSVSFQFSDILLKVLENYKIRQGKIIRKPIEGLADYYIRKDFGKSK